MPLTSNKVRFLTKTQLRTISYWKLRDLYAKLWRKRPEKPPYSHIVQIGDPRLRSKCTEVPSEAIKSAEIQALIKRMKHVLNRYDCVGISAPQIGVDIKIFAMEFSRNHMKAFSDIEIRNREMTIVPLTIVINPQLKIVDYTKLVFPESCASVRGFFAEVPRYRSVHLSGVDETGEAIKIEAVGWTARIIQHETDHLNGTIYTDIMRRDSFTCCCWEAVNESNGKVVLPFTPD